MIDQQQIKEMKNILLNSKAVTFEPNVRRLFCQFPEDKFCFPKDKFYVSNDDGHLTIDYFKFAEALYNTGYRKVGENAMVLTQEEWEVLHEQFVKAMYQKEVNTRKQMAEEIFGKLREKSIESFLDWEGNICYLNEEYVSIQDIKTVLKQLGMEV